MPLFIILPLWVLSLLACAALALFRRARRLAALLAISSSLATIGCVVLPIAAISLLLVPDQLGWKLPKWLEMTIGFGSLAAFPVGYVLGGLAGLILGHRWLWRRWPWKAGPDPVESIGDPTVVRP